MTLTILKTIKTSYFLGGLGARLGGGKGGWWRQMSQIGRSSQGPRNSRSKSAAESLCSLHMNAAAIHCYHNTLQAAIYTHFWEESKDNRQLSGTRLTLK